MAEIDERLLEGSLATLEAARSWAPRVVSRLEALIRSGPDEALFRINPIRFARDRSLTEGEAIDLFLHATASGLFMMDWMILCPMCSSIVESFGSLRTVPTNRYHCHFCQNDYEATLDDYIVIGFTVTPQVRAIAFHRPEALDPLTYMANVAFSLNHARCDVPRGSTCLSPQYIFENCLRGIGFANPGETATFEFVAGRLGEAVINGTEVFSGKHYFVPVGGGMVDEPQRRSIEFTGDGWHASDRSLSSGPVALELRNLSDRRILLVATEFPDAHPHCSTLLEFEPYLSAKRLLTTQTFRDLFRSEVIRGTEGIGVRDITLVFTDLKGSTELYERIGDLNAFSLVQQHFERLTDVTVRNNGAIIKTLGDALMAAFLTPVDAARAALAMQSEIARFNEARPGRDFILKVGLHRGASIAVTVNERLDYFGQSVNVAARVEALAEGGEICLTQEVFEAPGVASVLEGFALVSAPERLKGMQNPLPVWRIRDAASSGRTHSLGP